MFLVLTHVLFDLFTPIIFITIFRSIQAILDLCSHYCVLHLKNRSTKFLFIQKNSPYLSFLFTPLCVGFQKSFNHIFLFTTICFAPFLFNLFSHFGFSKFVHPIVPFIHKNSSYYGFLFIHTFFGFKKKNVHAYFFVLSYLFLDLIFGSCSQPYILLFIYFFNQFSHNILFSTKFLFRREMA